MCVSHICFKLQPGMTLKPALFLVKGVLKRRQETKHTSQLIHLVPVAELLPAYRPFDLLLEVAPQNLPRYKQTLSATVDALAASRRKKNMVNA